MIGRVFRQTGFALTRPAVFVPAAVTTLVFQLAARYLGLDDPARLNVSPRAVAWLTVLFLGRYWVLVSLSAVALAALRGQPSSIVRQWVPPAKFARITLVNAVAAAVITLGALVLVVPGIYLWLVWSQTSMLMIDDRNRLFDALGKSARLTRGHRWRILAAWLIVAVTAGVLSVVAWVLQPFGGPAPAAIVLSIVAGWVWNTLLLGLGVCLAAAVYVEIGVKPENRKSKA